MSYLCPTSKFKDYKKYKTLDYLFSDEIISTKMIFYAIFFFFDCYSPKLLFAILASSMTESEIPFILLIFSPA